MNDMNIEHQPGYIVRDHFGRPYTRSSHLAERQRWLDRLEADALVEEMDRVLDKMENQGVHCDPALWQKLDAELDALKAEIDRLLGIGQPLRCKPY